MKARAHLVPVATLVLMLNITPSWAQPVCALPGCNPTTSDGFGNTAGGSQALFLVKGRRNTGFGNVALPLLNNGNDNTAVGSNALRVNTDGSSNTAVGSNALHDNLIGNFNTAVGAQALYANISDANTAIGFNALPSNASGTFNTASGTNALLNNTTGSFNTASGGQALYHNVSGSNNTAVGINALSTTTVGSSNTAIGTNALLNSTGNKNIAIGFESSINLTSGSNNIYIGSVSGVTGGELQTIRLGKAQTRTFVAGIGTANVAGVPVLVDGNGQLGVAFSSARYKRNIENMASRSEGLLKLRPVTFSYKDETATAPHYGLIAEEVATVYPELVTRTASGEVQTVKYHELIPMLLNELQREHQELTSLRKELAELRSLLGSRLGQ